MKANPRCNLHGMATGLRVGLLAAAFLLPCLAPSLVSAQVDNDDDGVVPTQSGSEGSTGLVGGTMGTGPASGAFASSATGPTLFGEIAQGELRPGLARLRFESTETVTPVDDPLAATLVAPSLPLASQQFGPDLALQGDVAYTPGPVAGATLFEAAPESLAAATLLVVDTGVDLAQMLAGSAPVAYAEVLPGAPGRIDVELFQRKVESLAGVLDASYGVSWVYVSVDATGQRHISAVRASTAGGPLDVVIR